MDNTWVSAVVILVLVLIGGYFAASELALVSLRTSQVQLLATSGRRGARVAGLRQDSNRFLAAVQIGVTLAGFLSAAVGGATMAVKLTPVLTGWGLPEEAASTVALVAVTAVISYVSLVLGELVPKRLALQKPEAVSMFVAPPWTGSPPRLAPSSGCCPSPRPSAAPWQCHPPQGWAREGQGRLVRRPSLRDHRCRPHHYQFHPEHTGGAKDDKHPVVKVTSIDMSSR